MLDKNVKKQKTKIIQLAVATLCLSTMIWMLPTTVTSEPPASGDWIVTGNESYSNRTLVVEGDLIIRDCRDIVIYDIDEDGTNEIITGTGYWDNTLGRFVTHLTGTYISNFTVKIGEGYFVYVTTDSSWEHRLPPS